MGDVKWTDHDKDRLTVDWLAGVPTEEIGRRLHRTKNGIIGKAHRLELTPRANPIIRIDGQPPKRVRQRVKAIKRLSAEDKPLPAVKPTFDAPLSKPIFIPTISRQPCCWPIGVPRAPDFRFCGDPAPFGKPYCEFHRRVATVGSRREDAA